MYKYVIGSGGSAFVDGGIGAIQNLEIFDFVTVKDEKIPIHHKITPPLISTLERLIVKNRDLMEKLEFILPCDVKNPLTGPKGAAMVFGP